MTSVGTGRRPAPAESAWAEATFSIKKKTKKNRDRVPLPKDAIPAAKAAIAAAEAVEDNDEDPMHIFSAAVMKARRVLHAHHKIGARKSPTDSTTTITAAVAAVASAAAAAGGGGPAWAAELLDVGRRIADVLEALRSTQSAYLTREQDHEDEVDDDDSDEDGDYDE